MASNRIDVDEIHVNWLEKLQEQIALGTSQLTEWEENFICDLSLKIEQGQETITENQDAKLRQIAYDRLANFRQY